MLLLAGIMLLASAGPIQRRCNESALAPIDRYDVRFSDMCRLFAADTQTAAAKYRRVMSAAGHPTLRAIGIVIAEYDGYGPEC